MNITLDKKSGSLAPKIKVTNEDIPLANALEKLVNSPEWREFSIQYEITREVFIESIKSDVTVKDNDRAIALKCAVLKGMDSIFRLPILIIQNVQNVLKDQEAEEEQNAGQQAGYDGD